MKKTKWFGAALITAALAISASACGAPSGGGTGTGGGGGSAPKDDVYQDYNPDKQPGGDAFDFDGNYAPPELTIDGKGDDPQWQAITEPLTTFGKDVDGGKAVSVKVYRGKDALFFLFDVTDPLLLTQGNTNDDAVTRGDSIELYLDTLGDGGRSPQSDDYQINLGIHGKTRIMQGAGGQWGSWNGLIDYEVDLKGGTLNNGDAADDTGYSIEVMVPYKQIMIEKDDTIAVSFGQVDKVKSADSATGGADKSWNWYGWDWGGSFREPQAPDNYALLDKDNNLIDRDDQEKAPADIAGFVRDTEGAPVEGATASVEVGGEPRTATTGADGYFVIEDVDSEGTYTVTVRKTGYLDGVLTYTRAELRAANGGRVLKDFTITATAGLQTTTLSGTVKNVLRGVVSGATVTVKGTAFTSQTDSNGAFTIEGVPAGVGDVVLVVSKTGFGDSETIIEESDLAAGETTALGEVNLNLPYANCGEFATGGGKEGVNKQLFANIHTEISRALTGIEFRFDGTRLLSGKVELYIDVKESTGHRDQEPSLWRIDLNDDGSIGGSHYAGGAFSSAGLVYRIQSNTSEGGYHATLLVPYTYLGIGALETFGVSMGQFSTTANGGKGDWDGWGPAQFGFVDPAYTNLYIRVGMQNNLYKADNNETMVTLSGNAGQEGVTVSAKGVKTTSGANGAWSMNVPIDTNAIQVTYSKQGYVSKTTTIAAGYFDGAAAWSEDVTLAEHKVTISGTVTDQDGNPVKGVDVTASGGSVNVTVKTGEDGTYTLENITAFSAITITFEKEGYATGTTNFTAAQLMASHSLTANKQITSESAIVQIEVTGKIVGIGGAVADATVSVDGKTLTATTDSSGAFTLAGFDAVDSTITVSKEGYQDSKITFTAADLTAGETSYAFADCFLVREYAEFAKSQKSVNPSEANGEIMAGFVYTVTRTQEGLAFRFVGDKPFSTSAPENRVEIKLAPANGTGWTVDLRITASGAFEGAGADQLTGKRVLNADSASPVVEFLVPYAAIGIQSADTVRIAGGQWCKAGENKQDWNGMNLNGFIDTGWDAASRIYVAADNTASNTLPSAAAVNAELFTAEKKSPAESV